MLLWLQSKNLRWFFSHNLPIFTIECLLLFFVKCIRIVQWILLSVYIISFVNKFGFGAVLRLGHTIFLLIKCTIYFTQNLKISKLKEKCIHPKNMFRLFVEILWRTLRNEKHITIAVIQSFIVKFRRIVNLRIVVWNLYYWFEPIV